jgi:hypothetical protein
MSNNHIQDDTMKIQMQECEYRIPKVTLVEFPSNYGEIALDIKEELFHDVGDPLTVKEALIYLATTMSKSSL